MYFAYVLRNSESDKIYIGHTDNLEKRKAQHNNVELDKRSYTKRNKGEGIWEIIYYETFNTRKEAKKREGELKSSRGRAFIRQKILGR